jgi:hypothetical protein
MKPFGKKPFGNTQCGRLSVLAALCLGGLMGAGRIAEANTLYVATNGNDGHSGSASAPLQTIYQAIAKANSGDTILVAPGTYSGKYNTNLGMKNLTLASQQGAASTIIDGGGSAIAFWLNSSGLTRACVINGFTIQNTYNNGANSPGGGAMLIAFNSPTIENCVFKNCSSSANYGGGALCIEQANPLIVNCIFENCSSTGANSDGGAISLSDSPNVTIQACSFHQCSASRNGGALKIGFDGDTTSSAQVIQCAFRENNAPDNGGAISVEFGKGATITACAFLGNSAGEEGGAIYEDAPPLQVGSSTFVGNSAGDEGGAIADFGGNFSLTNCTVVNNSGYYWGGGVDVAYVSANIVNCILRGNQNPGKNSANQIENNNASLTVSYSDVQGGWTGTGNFDADPRFVQTPGAANVPYGDLHLQTVSPCIDAGTSSGITLPASDLDGNARLYGSAPDIGAYEMQPASRFNPNTYYRIVNLNSGYALDDFGYQSFNGAWVDQYPYQGQTNQQWRIVAVNGGYQIINRASGLALENMGFDPDNGAAIDQWTWNGGSNQLWSLSYQGAAIYKLVNVYSGLLLEDPNDSLTAGTLLDQWSDEDGANLNQHWIIIPVSN